MHILSDEELKREPQRLLDNAQRGEPVIVTVKSEPMMIAVPLSGKSGVQPALIDLAAALFDREQISLSTAARMAGLSYSEMIDELGRRGVSVIRLSAGELERELAAFDA